MKKYSSEILLSLIGLIIIVVLLSLQYYHLDVRGSLHLIQTVGVPLDDVYIHCRYAENLLNGYGYCFNPGSGIVTADTSPLWIVLIAFGGLFTSHLELVAVLLSSVFYILLLPVTYRIAKEVFQLTEGWSITASLLVGLSSRLLWSSVSGMEITVACLLTLLALREHTLRMRSDRHLSLYETVYLGLGIAVRPELMFLAVVLLGGWFIKVVRSGKGQSEFAAGVIVFLIVLLPVFLLPIIERGSLVYHSSVVQGAGLSIVPNVTYLLFIGKILVVSLVPPVPIPLFGITLRTKVPEIMPWIIFGLGLPILLAFIAPQFRHHGRYMFPSIPVLILVGVVVISFLTKSSKLAPYIQVVLFVVSLPAAYNWTFKYLHSVSNITEQHVAAADWILQNVSASDQVAAHDVGAIGYFTKRNIIDLTGLVSPSIHSLQHDQKEVWMASRRQAASVFVIYNRLNPTFYDTIQDSLQLLQKWSAYPLVASADTVMSVYRVKGGRNASLK